MDTDSKPWRCGRALGLLLAMLACCILAASANATRAAAVLVAQADADLPLDELKPPETTFGEPGVVDLTEGQKTYAQTSETTATAEAGANRAADKGALAQEQTTHLTVIALAVFLGFEIGGRAAPACRGGVLILATAFGGFVVVAAVLAGGTGDSYAAGIAAVVAVTMAAAAVVGGLIVAARKLGDVSLVPQSKESS